MNEENYKKAGVNEIDEGNELKCRTIQAVNELLTISPTEP